MIVDYVCDFCAEAGRVRLAPGDTIDSVQCPTCGEPVTPLAEYPDGPRTD